MTMTQEDKLSLDAYKEESKKNVADDIAAMDAVLEGGTVEPAQESAEPETDIFTGEPIEEVKDQRVGEAGPDDLVEEVKKAASVQEETEEAVEEGEYDFSFINDLARQALERGTQVPIQPVQAPQPVQQPVFVQPPAQPVAPVDLVTLDEMNAAFDSPEKMIGLLNKVYERARTDAIQQSLMALPNAVRPVVATEAAFVEKVKNFYDEHKELNKYRDFVKYCAVQVENAHPDWDYDQVMKETAKVAKSRLPMLHEAMQRESRTVKPSFVNPGGVKPKPSAKKLSRLEQELAAMPNY